MKKNIRYNIVLLLLMVEAVLIPTFAQMPEIKQGQSISFEEYLNRVGKKNLSYLAEKLNVSIADAEVIARKIFPDPELEFEAGNETFSLGVSYSLEMGNKRGADSGRIGETVPATGLSGFEGGGCRPFSRSNSSARIT